MVIYKILLKFNMLRYKLLSLITEAKCVLFPQENQNQILNSIVSAIQKSAN